MKNHHSFYWVDKRKSLLYTSGTTGFWWNNGEINKRSKTCPEGNWTKGKVKK
jgi:hypothetical protein